GLRQTTHDQRQQVIAVRPVHRRDRHDLGERVAPPPGLDDREHPALRPDLIGLIQNAESRPRIRTDWLQDERVGAIDGRGVDYETDEVDVLDGAPRGPQHEVAQLALGRVEPGRVDEDDLGAPEVLDAGDAVPGRLRARRDDRELLTHQAVQEGRLPGVGAPDERHEPRTVRYCSRIHERALVCWSGDREAALVCWTEDPVAALNRGWPETGAAWLRHARSTRSAVWSRSPCQSFSGRRRRPASRISRSRPCMRAASTGSRSS